MVIVQCETKEMGVQCERGEAIAVRWIIDYLTDRRQMVQIDRQSDMATVELGVPQGSILGPVIFNLYVADLQKELQCDLSVC